MISYSIRRAFGLFFVLVVVSILFFVLLKLVPGDPARTLAGIGATPEVIESYREYLGLNRPWHVQYKRFMAGMLTGSLESMSFHTSVRDLIMSRLPATVELGIGGILLALLVSLPMGIVAAVWQGSMVDIVATEVCLIGVSVPVFWTALILMLVAGVQLDILPVSGRGATLYGWSFLTVDGLRHLIIPILSIASVQMAMNARLVRSSMLEVLRSDYVITARSKGLRESVVIIRHAFRNALLPVVTNMGFMVGGLFAGGVLTETTTSWPGLGRLLYEALTRRDQTVLFTLVLLITMSYVMSYFIVDMFYAYLNPKITYE